MARAGDAKSSTVVPCDCQIDALKRRNRLNTYAQLGYLERMSFRSLRRNFRRVEDVDSFLKAKELAKDFADDPKGWLVLHGASGCGKTHFAVAIVNALINRGAPAKYVSALDIPDLIRGGWSRGQEEFASDEFTPLLDAPVLVIDDFGVQPTSEWVDTKIDQLLTFRFNSRAPTVVALAKSLNDLPERHATKLSGSTLTQIINLSPVEVDRAGNPMDVLRDKSFDNFDSRGDEFATPEQQDLLYLALCTAKNFVENPEKSMPWLYLQGDTGVGKTHLALAIAGASIDNGVDVSYWSLPRFLDRLRQTYSKRDETDFLAFFDSVREAELLILDDFGTQQMTEWSLEKLYQLIAFRHDRRLRTVIAGHHKIWDPIDAGEQQRQDPKPKDKEQQKPDLEVHLTDIWTYLIDSEREIKRMKLILEHQWHSIISRLSDHQTVTIIALQTHDYRIRGGGDDPGNYA